MSLGAFGLKLGTPGDGSAGCSRQISMLGWV